MAAAKQARTNPRQLAQQWLEATDLNDIASDVAIAGPGFLNFTLRDAFLSEQLSSNVLLNQSESPQHVVVDYSSPNLAKEMHVGHLRSTVIGDAMVRILTLQGHIVTRQNHIGDWGTGFGRTLAYLAELSTTEQEEALSDMDSLYVKASQRFESEPAFANQSRDMVISLQKGDEVAQRQWQFFMDKAHEHMEDIYERLDITLTRDDVRGESSYNSLIPDLLETLGRIPGLIVKSEGALCIFMSRFKNKAGEVQPMIVLKSDGGYLYHTTDLAALRYRVDELHADRVLYFTDTRQKLHFEMLFAAARLARIAPEQIKLEHHPFGQILGMDGKPFKSRSGGNVLLRDLLDEAIQRATRLVRDKNPDMDDATIESVSRALAIGAVKYADLSKNRLHDYTFDWDEMLAFDGNTAPYLQYAFARIQSIFRRAGVSMEECLGEPQIKTPEEHQLAVQLLRLTETINQVTKDVKPHILCAYLYELTTRFMRFYEQCPILNQVPHIKDSRLRLSRRTAETLQLGLHALGIQTLARM